MKSYPVPKACTYLFLNAARDYLYFLFAPFHYFARLGPAALAAVDQLYRLIIRCKNRKTVLIASAEVLTLPKRDNTSAGGLCEACQQKRC